MFCSPPPRRGSEDLPREGAPVKPERVGLVHNPPFELYVFIGGRVEADNEIVARTGENLKNEVFATFNNSKVDLGCRNEIGVGKTDLFAAGGKSGSASESVAGSEVGDFDLFGNFRGGDDEITVGGSLDEIAFERTGWKRGV